MTSQILTFYGSPTVAQCARLDVDTDEKYERRRGASLPASSILKNYNTVLFDKNFTLKVILCYPQM